MRAATASELAAVPPVACAALAVGAGLAALARAAVPTLSPALLMLAGGVVSVGLGAAALPHVARIVQNEMARQTQRHPRWLRWAWMTAAIFSVVNFARFSVFMVDPGFRAGTPLLVSESKHMCLPAYLRAGELARQQPSGVYRGALYNRKIATTGIEGMQPWMRDPFVYPPPALVPAKLALAITDDFHLLRSLWFCLQTLGFVAASLILAPRLEPVTRARYLWLWPLLALSWPLLTNLEFGQAHSFTLVLAIVGMALLATRRALGAALLGAAIAVKLFPAVLGAYLLACRRWRDAGALTLATAAWFLLSVPAAGLEVHAAFFGDHLPELMSGSAFATFLAAAQFDTPHLSPQALAFTIQALGWDGVGAAAPVFGILYATLIVAAVWRARHCDDHPLVWMSLLTLGASASAVAPAAYTAVAAFWLCLLLAAHSRRPRVTVAFLLGAALFHIAPYFGLIPPFWSSPELAMVGSIVMTLALIGFAIVVLWHPWWCAERKHMLHGK